MLTPQIILASSTTTNVLIGAIVLGYAASVCLQLYYHGWQGHDDGEEVPISRWIKKNNTWEEKITYGVYGKYINKNDFDWEWITPIRKMGWVEQTPPAQVTIICSDDMKPEVHKLIKAANDLHHK